MTNQAIPAQAVEAAMRAWLERSKAPGSWSLEEEARAALEAAAPHMLAAAWEQGYMFSYDQERGGNGELPIPVPEYLAEDLAHWNPYRRAVE